MDICAHLRHLRLVTRLTADYTDERRWKRFLLGVFVIGLPVYPPSAYSVYSAVPNS
jgi:hypothetical protein